MHFPPSCSPPPQLPSPPLYLFVLSRPPTHVLYRTERRVRRRRYPNTVIPQLPSTPPPFALPITGTTGRPGRRDGQVCSKEPTDMSEVGDGLVEFAGPCCDAAAACAAVQGQRCGPPPACGGCSDAAVPPRAALWAAVCAFLASHHGVRECQAHAAALAREWEEDAARRNRRKVRGGGGGDGTTPVTSDAAAAAWAAEWCRYCACRGVEVALRRAAKDAAAAAGGGRKQRQRQSSLQRPRVSGWCERERKRPGVTYALARWCGLSVATRPVPVSR